MKYLFCVLVVFCSLAIAAQTAQDDTKTAGRLSLGLYGNPAMGYRWLTGGEGEQYLQSLRDEEEQIGFSYRAGLLFAYPMGKHKRWQWQMGMLFGDRSFQTKIETLVWVGGTDQGMSRAFRSHHYYYLDLPLKLRYNFWEQQAWKAYVTGGVSLAVFYQYHKNQHVYNDGTWQVHRDEQTLSGANQLNFVASIEPGISYQLAPRLELLASIALQLPFNPSNTHLNLKEYLFDVGLGIGILWQL